MILWHLGATIAIVRYVFRDPGMDLRVLALGALLPDLIDKPIGLLLFHEQLQNDRLLSHALLFPVVLLLLVMLATRRGTVRRKAMLGLPIGSFIHLFLDGQWSDPEGFWWPLLGWSFPALEGQSLGEMLVAGFTDPWLIAGEVVGLIYLVWLYRAAGLSDRERRRAFLATGRIPLPLRG